MSKSDDALAALQNGPVTADTSTQRQTNIGVPNDYTPPARSIAFGEPNIPGQRPFSESQMGMGEPAVRYPAGSELKPLQTPEIVPQLQAQLVQIGYLDPKNVRPGYWDTSSQSAYKKLLGDANRLGVTAQDAFRILAANPTIGDLQGGSGSSRAPLVVQQTNPLDIAATAQETAQKLLGRNLTEAELKPFIEQYQALESSSQTKAYKVGGTGKNATIVNPPSNGAFSEDYFKKNFGQEEMGYAAVERMNEFYSLLGSPVSNG